MTKRTKKIVIRQILTNTYSLSAPIFFHSIKNLNGFLGRGRNYVQRNLSKHDHIISSSGELRKFFIIESINFQTIETEKEELKQWFKLNYYYDGDIDMNGNSQIKYLPAVKRKSSARREEIQQLLIHINIHYRNLIEAEGSQEFKQLQKLLHVSA